MSNPPPSALPRNGSAPFGVRVLIAHADPATAASLQQVFKSAGHAADVWDGSLPLEVLAQRLGPTALIVDSDAVSNPQHLLGVLAAFRPRPETIGLVRTGNVTDAVALMRAGARDVLEAPVEAHRLIAAVEAVRPVPLDSSVSPLPELVGNTSSMRELYELIEQVAPTDAPVLVVGEHGTGKERVASAVHRLSRRSTRAFVKVNVGAIPDELLESELFGHVKGAFTGALADKPGLVEAADGGSLLLDEIAEMSPRLQAKLLRLLQQREFRRVGSSRLSSADFRLIASTNVDTRRAMQEGTLRQDLYFRISTVVLRVPPLRARRPDVPLLAEHFLRFFRQHYRRQVASIRQDALDALVRYEWPGNVRELEHVIQRAVILAKGPEVTPADLPILPASRPASADAPVSAASMQTLADLERTAIQRALERTGGNKVAAAAMLGVRRPTLYNKLRKHGLPYRPGKGN